MVNDMLIISNDCTAADIYVNNKTEYNHPFMWCIILYEDMKNLILNWETLNFSNYKIEKSKLKENTYIVNIDNKVKVHYVHYIEDSKYTKPTKTKDKFGYEKNISYNKIIDYIEEKYTKRYLKLKATDEKPTFIIHYFESNNCDYKENNIQELINLNKNYKLYIYGNFKKLKTNTNNILIQKFIKYPSEVAKLHNFI